MLRVKYTILAFYTMSAQSILLFLNENITKLFIYIPSRLVLHFRIDVLLVTCLYFDKSSFVYDNVNLNYVN